MKRIKHYSSKNFTKPATFLKVLDVIKSKVFCTNNEKHPLWINRESFYARYTAMWFCFVSAYTIEKIINLKKIVLDFE